MNRQPTFQINRRDALRYLALGGASLALAPLARAASSSTPASTAGAARAPALTGPQAPFYRFKIGDLEAVALLDGEIAGPIDQMSWWAGASPEQMKQSLHAAFLPEDTVRLSITVTLVRCEDQLVLIDAGAGNLFGPAGGKLTESLAAVGVKPEQINVVVLTHLHGDHFGGLLDANRKPAFPNAKILISRREHEFFSQPNPDFSAIKLPAEAIKQSLEGAHAYLAALKDRWEFVAGGDKPLKGIEIVDAPGHTPGHVGVLLGTGADRILHVADAAHHHAFSFDHPEWAFLFDVQPKVAEQTRRSLLERAARERLRIAGAHLPFPALGHVRKDDNGFEYVIEPWVGA